MIDQTTDPPSTIAAMVLGLAFLAVSLSGCIVPEEGPLDAEAAQECSFYPDRPYLRDKWSVQANRTKEGFDVVVFGVSTWGKNSWEEPNETPELFVNWTHYPDEERPEILQDVVCWVLGRLEAGWSPPFTTGTNTAHRIATATMDEVRWEHLNQTGVWLDDDCCYLWLDGEYYGVGWHGSTATWPDGTGSSCC